MANFSELSISQIQNNNHVSLKIAMNIGIQPWGYMLPFYSTEKGDLSSLIMQTNLSQFEILRKYCDCFSQIVLILRFAIPAYLKGVILELNGPCLIALQLQKRMGQRDFLTSL